MKVDWSCENCVTQSFKLGKNGARRCVTISIAIIFCFETFDELFVEWLENKHIVELLLAISKQLCCVLIQMIGRKQTWLVDHTRSQQLAEGPTVALR